MQKQSVLLIINPVAGRKKAKSLIFKIVDSLCRNNCKTTIFTTTKRGEATSIVIDHAKGHQRIICCGGDGTLNEVVSGLAKLNLQIPIGFIPTGTTNDLARSLKLPTKTADAIILAEKGEAQQHDVGSFNENLYFSYVSSFGAFSSTSYSTAQWAKNLFGRIAYIFKGLLGLSKIKSQKVTVVTDEQKITGNFIFGCVSNSVSIGGILKFMDSDVCVDDGKFEVLLIKKPSRLKHINSILKSISLHKYNSPNIYFLKTSKISFISEKDIEWSIDGEFAGTFNNVEIENLPRMVSVVTKINETELS